jgi:hypothetical protein
VATSGSALTFNGSTLGLNTLSTGLQGAIVSNGTAYSGLYVTGTGYSYAGAGANESWFYAGNTLNIGSDGNLPIKFLSNGSEQMRLTSTGLGIGTASPSYKLHVVGGAAIANRTTSDTPGNIALGVLSTSSVAQFGWRTDTSNNLHFDIYNGASWSAALTTSLAGNLGLGVTPSAWSSAFGPVIQVKTGSGGGALTGSSTDNFRMFANTFYDGAYKRIGAGYATQYEQASGQHAWYTAGTSTASSSITFTQALTLDASGNLGVGTTSPTSPITVKAQASDNVGIRVLQSSSNSALFQFTNDPVTAEWASLNATSTYLDISSAGYLGLKTNNAERVRITAAGFFKASNSGSGAYVGATGPYYEFISNDVTTNNSFIFYNNSASNGQAAMMFWGANRNTTNNTYYYLGCYNYVTSTYKLRIADSGDVTNTNGTYGTISDVKMKTDIVDASSQWADVKALRFRKFKLKNDPAKLTQLGVIAQEVEQVSPGLVDEHVDCDAEGKSLGTTTKSVKTSVLLMKAAVALQEAMARIEQLEAKVAVLENK